MKWLNRRKEITVLSPLEGYNLWAASYHQESNPIKNLSDSLIEKLLPDLQDKRFMDAGCGTGKFCIVAKEKNASHIFGLDLSPAMIDVARENCKSAEFQCGDLASAVIKEKSYDVIICALVLGHLEHLEPALDKLLKALKTGATIIITDFHPYLTLSHAKRTFTDKQTGQNFEVHHYLHLFQEYFEYFAKYGVVVDTLEEPLFKESPVIFAIRARKK